VLATAVLRNPRNVVSISVIRQVSSRKLHTFTLSLPDTTLSSVMVALRIQDAATIDLFTNGFEYEQLVVPKPELLKFHPLQ
jgi:hypothetical protein